MSYLRPSVQRSVAPDVQQRGFVVLDLEGCLSSRSTKNTNAMLASGPTTLYPLVYKANEQAYCSDAQRLHESPLSFWGAW